MIHYQNDVILHLTNDNLQPNGEPIINIGDLILFSTENNIGGATVTYDTFFKWIDMYFEYTEHGSKENRTIKITGLLTRFQN
jgi:hypothetical protein